MVPQLYDDAALRDLHPIFSVRLVPWLAGPYRDNHGAVVPGHFSICAVDGGIIIIRFLYSRFAVIRTRILGTPPKYVKVST